MSFAKRQLEEMETYKNIAKEILSDLDAIKVCPVCEDWYTTTNFQIEPEIYAKATNILKERYPEYDDFSTYHAMIKEIENEASINDECPFCQ